MRNWRSGWYGIAALGGTFLSTPFHVALAQESGAATAPNAQAGAVMSVGVGPGGKLAAPSAKPSAPAAPGTYHLPTVSISAHLDRLRSAIEPDLGATVYKIGRSAIETIPQGDNAPLNDVLLQAPGVAQDSFGQIHVRGDHNEIQFRLDGVQLPEGLTVFGQALETRFAHSLELITGALPAEYGFDTAAVINIQTKTGITDPGGDISIYGGARDYFQPSFQYGTSAGAFDLFVTGDFVHNRVGVENPTGSFNPVHDLTNQTHGLVHLDAIPDPTSRVSFLAGFSNEFYEIPNNPSQTPSLGLNVDGITNYDSADLTEHQREVTDFDILSYQKSFGQLDVQTEVFNRYSSLYYTPDPVGDLLFNGIAQTAARSVFSTGEQTDGSWFVSTDHTIRAGFQVIGERNVSSTVSSVLPAIGTDGAGDTDGGGVAGSISQNGIGSEQPVSTQPFNIYQGLGKTGGLYGGYVQDEWHVLPHVIVNYGTRFDVVDEYTHENQLSPRVNLVWTPTKTTTVHGGYSRYFVPPPFELVGQSSVTIFNGTSAASPVTEDTTVKAERDNYYDGGISQVILPGWQIGVDAYYKEAENLIDEGQFGAPIILTAFNYAHGDDHGVELNTTYDKGPWSLYANLARSRAVGKDIDSAQFNFTADELAYISQHFIYLDHNQTYTGSGGAAYTAFQPTSHPLRLSTDIVVGSGLRADGTIPNGQALPGYATINLAAVQTLHLPGWKPTQLRLDVINLLDRVYEIRNGTGVGVGAPQYGLRRTILVGLAQRF